LSVLHKSWLSNAGAILKDPPVDIAANCEISPLVSINGEGLQEYVSGLEMQLPLLLRMSNERIPASEKPASLMPFTSHPQVQMRIDPQSNVNIYEIIYTETSSSTTPPTTTDTTTPAAAASSTVVLDRLKHIDINNTTPMQALHILAELQELLQLTQ
jgi:hypothetical protein